MSLQDILYETQVDAQPDGDGGWHIRFYPIEPEPSTFEMPLWSQRDPAWADVKLGSGTATTIGSYGCLLTCVAMMASAATETEITPPVANEALKAVNGFTGPNKNLLKFTSIIAAWPELKLAGIHNWEKVAAQLGKIDAVIDAGGWGLAKIDFVPGGGVNEHWVLIRSRAGSVYEIIDPWYGTVHSLPPAYCSSGWNAARAIFKVALYK